MAYDIRKTQVSIEEIWHERGPRRAQPLLIGTALAVINNPFAGRYEPDLKPFQAELRDLGRQLARTLCERLGGKGLIEAYGKGAIVGGDGELEHGAVWHEAGGAAIREVIAQARRSCLQSDHPRDRLPVDGAARPYRGGLCPQPFRHRRDDDLGRAAA